MKSIVILAAVILTGCGGGSNQTAALEAKISKLEAAVDELKDSQIAMRHWLQAMSVKSGIDDMERVAYLRPGDNGYAALRFDLGVITVKLDNVQPYASGSKVTLSFGNLSSAQIDGLKGKLDWGVVDKNGAAQDDKAKTRDMQFQGSLPAGSWRSQDVVLEGVPPVELGFVRLHDVSHQGINLRR